MQPSPEGRSALHTHCTFVVCTGVGRVDKLFEVAHLLRNVDQQFHRLVLAVLEVQQSLHQGSFTVGLICEWDHTLGFVSAQVHRLPQPLYHGKGVALT